MTPVRMAVIGAGHLGQIHARLLRGMADVQSSGRWLIPTPKFEDILRENNMLRPMRPLKNCPPNWMQQLLPRRRHNTRRSREHCLLAKSTSWWKSRWRPPRRTRKCSVRPPSDSNEFCRWDTSNVIIRHGPERHALVRDPVFIEAHRMAPYAVRSTDVGVVMDLMVHDLELALHAVDSEVVRVTAVGFCFFGQHEDIAQARLEFRNGALAHLTASRVSSTMARTWHLVTPQLSAQVDLAEHRLEIIRPRPDTPTEHARVCSLPPARRRWFRDHLFETLLTREAIDVPPVNALVQELEEFVAAVRGEQPVRVDGRAGAEAVVLAERVIESLRKKTSDAPLRPLQLQNGITATSPVAEPIRQRYAG